MGRQLTWSVYWRAHQMVMNLQGLDSTDCLTRSSHVLDSLQPPEDAHCLHLHSHAFLFLGILGTATPHSKNSSLHRLTRQLLQQYHKEVRPVHNWAEATTVYLDLCVHAVLDVVRTTCPCLFLSWLIGLLSWFDLNWIIDWIIDWLRQVSCIPGWPQIHYVTEDGTGFLALRSQVHTSTANFMLSSVLYAEA